MKIMSSGLTKTASEGHRYNVLDGRKGNMIYGTKDYRSQVFKYIFEISEEKGMDVIYAGTVGSISQGISTYDSDYDIKCLYVPRGGQIKDLHNEEDIRYRRFYKDKSFNCIAFWEIYAFFNFLAEPYIDSGMKYDLFHNVLWLMMTPYAWDPLGLQGKLYHFICDCVDMQNELLYYRLIIEKLIGDEITFKHIIRLLHSFLCIEWIDRRGTLPPINILGMMLVRSENMEGTFSDIFDEYKKVNVMHANLSIKDKKYDFLIDMIKSRLEIMDHDINYYQEYRWEKIMQNKEIVKRINEVVFMSMGSVPQIEGEGYIKWNDLNNFF